MNTNISIQKKILAYFNGQLTSVEEAKLFIWIKESEENRQVFFHLKNKLDPDKMDHPLLQSSYAELRNKLFIKNQFEVTRQTGIRKFQFSLQKIAAVILLAASFGFAVAYLLSGRSSEQSKIVWFETKVPRGEKSQLMLPDGSKVWLNSESSLSYPNNFMDGNRDVKLKGEAYFEVAKQKGSVFTVETHDYNVRVLGTKFNVTAYEDFKRTETSLIEGRIEIQKEKQTMEVVPGQMLIYKDHQFYTEETNTIKSAKWKDDIFDFDRITFRELVVRLERWYDLDIEIRNPELNDKTYSGVFKNEETIEEVLNTFQLTMPISYKREGFRKISIIMNK